MFGGAFLDAAAHDLGDRHACDADGIQRAVERLKLVPVGNDGDLGHLKPRIDAAGGGVDLDGYGGVYRRALADKAVGGHKIGVAAGQAVLGNIQAGDLLGRGHAQADGFFDEGIDDDHHHRDPSDDGDNTQCLHAEEREAAAVERAAVCGKQAGEQRARCAAKAVYADGADGVVDLQLFIDEFDAKNNDESGYEADAGSAEGVDHIAPCRYSHQAGQRSV